MAQILDEAHNTPVVLRSLGLGARLARTWSEWNGPAIDFDDRLAGLGFIWPAVAVPALLALAWRVTRGKTNGGVGNVVFAVLLTIALFALQPMKWWARYTIWLWGAGALAIGIQGERLLGAGRDRLFGVLASMTAALAIGEGAFALAHANGASLAFARPLTPGARPSDPLLQLNSDAPLDPAFKTLGLASEHDVCRGSWKPGSDDANLDGVFAELTPRPRVHVVPDDDRSWREVHGGFLNTGCSSLLLFEKSPVIRAALEDPSVSVQPAVAFDPLYVVRPRKGAPIARLSEKDP
jgi:hypothetical protein